MNWFADMDAPTFLGVERRELIVHFVFPLISNLLTFVILAILIRGKISNGAV